MEKLNKLLKLKDNKTKTVLKNVFFSVFIKGVNISIGFLTIPLVLSFLDTTQYGIWLTLVAVIGWFALFDLGFGNGLRNSLTTSIASNNHQEGKIYVSTTYAALTCIFGFLLIVFFIINPFVEWYKVFNAPERLKYDVQNAVTFAISFLFIQFVLRLINTVLLSFQRAAMADLTNTLGQVCILAGIFILKILHHNSLTALSLVYSIMPVVVFLIFSIILFSKTYRHVSPSIVSVKFKQAKGLLNIGLNFFVIQVAALILFASDNFIIAQLFHPSDVTTYNIAFKYFSVTNIIFTIVLAPFWSMTTKSFVENDTAWIKGAVKKLLVIWLALFIIEIIQLLVSGTLYKILTHDTVMVPLHLSMVMCLYFFIMNWGLIFGNFLNGVGKIKLQLYFSVVGMIVNIPLAIFFIKFFDFGILGVPLATICTMLGGNLIATIQYRKIITGTASGIWNK